VVAVGLTVVEPLAEVDVNVPGVMAMLVAPVVLHASVLLEPDSMLPGLAVKKETFGLVMVTFVMAVTEPEESVAVSV
jgi:hypothetical protein